MKRLLLLLFLPLTTFAQQLNPAYNIGLNASRGFTLMPADRVANLGAHTTGAELELSRDVSGEYPWHRRYNYPQEGVLIGYTDLGLPNITGKAFSAMVFLQSKLIGGRNSQLRFRAAPGLAYVTKVFDQHTNPKNKAISSRVNVSLQFKLLYCQRFWQDRMEGQVGLGFSHFSAGSYSLPNNGINVPSVSAGLLYRMPYPAEPEIQPADTFRRHWSFATSLSWATKSAGNFGEKRFEVFVLGLRAQRSFDPRHRLALGVDLFHDPAMPYATFRDYGPQTLGSTSQAGVIMEYESVFGHLSFPMQFGYYLYNPDQKETGNYYQRFGLRYRVWKELTLGVLAKIHFGNADYLEWAVGYRLGL